MTTASSDGEDGDYHNADVSDNTCENKHQYGIKMSVGYADDNRFSDNLISGSKREVFVCSLCGLA